MNAYADKEYLDNFNEFISDNSKYLSEHDIMKSVAGPKPLAFFYGLLKVTSPVVLDVTYS